MLRLRLRHASRLLLAACWLTASRGQTDSIPVQMNLTATTAAVEGVTAVLPATFTPPAVEPHVDVDRETVNPAVPVPQGSQSTSTPPTGPAVAVQSLAVTNAAPDPNAFQYRYHDFTASETGSQTSTIGESSLASMDRNTIFYAANDFAALSTDGGLTFSYISPQFAFPSSPGEFCCDQVVQYAPSRNMMIWALQYYSEGSSRTVRIAVAVGANVAARQWTYYDFTAQSFGLASGFYLDFPNLTIGSTYLYVTANVSNSNQRGGPLQGSVIFRIPLSQLAAGAKINFQYVNSPSDSWRCTDGAATTMYCVSHFFIDNQVLIAQWGDGSNSFTGETHQLNSFVFMGGGQGRAVTPDGLNFAASADSRISGAWVYGGIIGIAFAAQQDPPMFPYPYVIIAQFDQSSHDLIDQNQIYSRDYAYLYPTVTVNAAGGLGGLMAFGGGSHYPNEAVWIADNSNPRLPVLFQSYQVTAGAHGPNGRNGSGWGDFFSVRRDAFNPNTFIAGAYDMRTGQSDGDVVQRFVRFGHTRDFTCSVTVDSDPPELSVQFDGVSYTAPHSADVPCASTHAISTSSSQGNLGGIYKFANWSDGGSLSHTITAPAAYNAFYTAAFTATQYFLNIIVALPASGPSGGTASPISGYFNAGQTVTIAANPDPMFRFSGWTGNGSGSYSGSNNPSTVVMNGPIMETAAFSGGDTVPPNGVRLTKPAPGQSVSGPFTLGGTAQDNSGTVRKMEFYLDSDTAPACYDGAPKASGSAFLCTYDMSLKPSGVHSLVAKAYDTAGNSAVSAPVSFIISNLAAMASPFPGSTLPGSSVTFAWNAVLSATAYWLDVGTTPGKGDISAGQLATGTLSKTVSGIPTDGSTVFVRLWTQVNGSWTGNYNDYSYSTFIPPSCGLATVVSPVPGTQLPGAAVTFAWSARACATAYWLDVGTAPGVGNISAGQFSSAVVSATIAGIPATGQPIWVRLWTQINGKWDANYHDYMYTSSAGCTLAALTSPALGSVLAGPAVTFTWSAGNCATAYWLDVGDSQGVGDISAGQLPPGTLAKTVSAIPGGGRRIWVRLWTQLNGHWDANYQDYSFTSPAANPIVIQPH